MSSDGGKREKSKSTGKKHAVKQRREDHARNTLEKPNAKKSTRKPLLKVSQFNCPLSFRNTLPDIPCNPKFLEYPFDARRFTKYTGLYEPTKLEELYKFQIHPEPDLGIGMDLVDPDKYKVPTSTPQLAAEDERLLNWEKVQKEEKEQRMGKSSRMEKRPDVTWLRKTVYTENDLFDNVHKFVTEAQVKENQEKRLSADLDSRARTAAEKIIDIQATFDAANSDTPLVHPTKKGMKIASVVPLLPAVDLWVNNYTNMVFGYDPLNDAEISKKSDGEREEARALKRRKLGSSYVCNVRTDRNDTVASLLLPTEDPEAVAEAASLEDPSDEAARMARENECHWSIDCAMDFKRTRGMEGGSHWAFFVPPAPGISPVLNLAGNATGAPPSFASYVPLELKIELIKGKVRGPCGPNVVLRLVALRCVASLHRLCSLSVI